MMPKKASIRIVGGNFGLDGSVFISGDRRLIIEGARQESYIPNQINSINTEIIKPQRFSPIRFMLCLIVVTYPLLLLIGIFGVVLSFLLSLALGFYIKKENIVEIEFDDGKSLRLQGEISLVNELVEFASSKQAV
jgi:hypothetical protein